MLQSLDSVSLIFFGSVEITCVCNVEITSDLALGTVVAVRAQMKTKIVYDDFNSNLVMKQSLYCTVKIANK